MGKIGPKYSHLLTVSLTVKITFFSRLPFPRYSRLESIFLCEHFLQCNLIQLPRNKDLGHKVVLNLQLQRQSERGKVLEYSGLSRLDFGFALR